MALIPVRGHAARAAALGAGVLVIGHHAHAVLGRSVDDVPPHLRLVTLVDPGVTAVLGRVPVLVVAELEEVLGEGVDAEEPGEAHLGVVPVDRAREGAVLRVTGGDHQIGHLLAPEDVAAREIGGRVVDGEVELLGARHREEADVGDGRAGVERRVLLAELAYGDPEAVRGLVGEDELVGVAHPLHALELLVEHEERAVALPLSGERVFHRLGRRVGVRLRASPIVCPVASVRIVSEPRLTMTICRDESSG